MLDFPRIPLAEWVNAVLNYIQNEHRPFLRGTAAEVEGIVELVQDGLLYSAWLTLVALIGLALLTGGWRLGAFTFAGMTLVHNLGLWEPAMITLSLILTAGLLCVLIGAPVGVAVATFPWAKRVARPVLDLMQTMPAFVYLIPAVGFFGLNVVAAVFATLIFALPPMVRLTAHGIEQVSREFVEASEAFGANRWQTLVKVQLPLARPSILVGLNQTLMMCLSMVVIAAMIGAEGLGGVVLAGVNQADAGIGFEGGIAIVVLAIILDRITQGFGRPRRAATAPGGGLFAGLGASMKRTALSVAGTARFEQKSPPRIESTKDR